MSAQPVISFEGLPGSGVELLEPGSADFRVALRDGIDAAGSEVLRPVEPFLVIVRNRSQKALVAVMIRYESISRTGEAATANSLWLTTQNLDRRKAHPGERVLMGPFGGFCRVLSERLVMQDAAGASSDVVRRAAAFSDAVRVRIGLDSVDFDDGTMVGPDRADLQRKLQAYLRTERGLRQELLSLPAHLRRAHLTGIVEGTEMAVQLELNPTGAYAAHRAGTARILLNLMENARSEVQFLAWLNQVAGNPIPDPHQRN